MSNTFFDFFFFWIRPVHLDFHRFFLSPNHINKFALPHKTNFDYRTVPELVHGVDFAYMSHEFVNVSTRGSFKTLYSMPYNVIVMTVLFFITYGAFIYLFCQTLSNEETDYMDDFCVNVDLRSGSDFINFGSGVNDLESFLGIGSVVSNTLPEDLEEELDTVLPHDSFLSDDLSTPYEHPNSYVDDFSFDENSLFNRFYDLGTDFPAGLTPPGSTQPTKIICNPDFWFHKGGRAAPLVKGPRLKRVLGDKVEELYKMKHFHQFYNYRTFTPLDHAGDGPITYKQRVEDSRSDPFLIPTLMPGSPISEETTQDFAEQISEAVDAWYPEGQMQQSVYDEIFFEIDIDPRFNQTIPYDMTTASITMNLGNHALPVFNQPRVPGDTDQVRPLVYLDPQDMLIFEPDSFDDSYTVTDSSDIPIAGYSDLSHNFDFGSYFKGPELFPDLGEHVLLPHDDYAATFGSFAPSYKHDLFYENRGFTILFPALDITYSADAVNFKEEVLSDFVGLDSQLRALKGAFKTDHLCPGPINRFGFTTLPVVWDTVSPSWKVFNYNSNSWVRLTDFLVWAGCRRDFLYSEAVGFKGRLFDWKAPTSYLVGVRLRVSFIGRILVKLASFVSRSVHSFLTFSRTKPIFDFFSFNFSVFTGSTNALVEEGDESSFDNPSYTLHGIGSKVLPQWGREEILVNSLYGYFKEDDPIRGYEDSSIYPYWLRLGIFNTADYLDSVDEFDPSMPTWVSRVYELYAEDFSPFIPLSDFDLIRSYYLSSPSSLRKTYKQFSNHSVYSVPDDDEPLMLARFNDSWFSGTFKPDHPIRRQSRLFEQLKKDKVFLKIASYDFSDFSPFRHLSHSRIKELLKDQVVTEDHIINRDFLAKTTAIQKKKDFKKSAKLRVRISKMRSSGLFAPIGRLETRLIPLPEHEVYIKLKYVDRPPSKMPVRRKVFRRF